jgi:hypothetical protein
MTPHQLHDALMAKINEEIAAGYEDSCGNYPFGLNALRVVVELHKPRNYRKAGDWCIGCNADYNYPCPTIQAVEAELKG